MESVPFNNLLEHFERTTLRQSSLPCLRYKVDDDWLSLTWSEVHDKIVSLAASLKKIGIQKDDKVSIISKTRYEWMIADLAIIAAGGVVVPIYETSSIDQLAYILQLSDAKVAFIDDSQWAKIKPNLKELPNLKKIISFSCSTAEANEGVLDFKQFLNLSKSHESEIYYDSLKNLKRDDLMSIVFTSGTTGPPKGAMLTHENFLSQVFYLQKVLPHCDHSDKPVLFLPLSHIIARVVQFVLIYWGSEQCYAKGLEDLIVTIREVKPTFFASVPRIFEKIHSNVFQNLNNSSSFKKKIFAWGMKVGKKRFEYQSKAKSVPLKIKLQNILARILIFNKLKKKLGGKIRFIVSGGAPLSNEINLFFHIFEIPILEGYGMTETCGALGINSLQNLKIGTIGKPLECVQIQIASDGEILAKGSSIFKGYYKNQQATQEAIDSEGWLHTGDIGEIDADGFLKITDRKKDLIVTAGGKNVAPQNIENLMKTSPYISQFFIYGDKRKFLSALVTLDRAEIENYAQKLGLCIEDYEKLIQNERIYNLIKTHLEEVNKKLARYETIKKFAILPHEFSVETGELTPTLKYKRKVIQEKYQDILDRFYVD